RCRYNHHRELCLSPQGWHRCNSRCTTWSLELRNPTNLQMRLNMPHKTQCVLGDNPVFSALKAIYTTRIMLGNIAQKSIEDGALQQSEISSSSSSQRIPIPSPDNFQYHLYCVSLPLLSGLCRRSPRHRQAFRGERVSHVEIHNPPVH